MGKEYSENLRSINNTGNNLTMKQMFDISQKLTVGQSEEIYGVNTTMKQMFEKSEKLIVEQSDEIFWSVSNQLGRFFMETIIFGC